MPHRHWPHPSFHLNLHLSLGENIKHLYEFTLIRSALLSSIGLFLPLYIYKMLGLWAVFLYTLFSFGVSFLAMIPITVKIMKRGVEFSWFLSIFLLLLQYFLIYFFDLNLFLLILIAFINGFAVSLYWVPYHSVFSKYGNLKVIAEEVALLLIVIAIISGFLPALSSYIILNIGFKSYFIIFSSLILALSIYLIKHLKKKTEFDFKIKIDFKHFWLFFLEGFRVYGLFSILFVYVVLKDILKFGLVFTISSLIATIISYFIAKKIDKSQQFKIAAPLLIIYHLPLLLFFSFDAILVSLSVLLVSLLSPISNSAYSSYLYYLSKKEKDPSLIGIKREIYLSFGKIIYFTISFITLNWYLIFLIPIISSILQAYIINREV